MPITTDQLELYLSGGATNTDPELSLGGIISNTQVPSPILHNVFDKIVGEESSAGDTEYRVIYIRNGNSTLNGERWRVYLTSNYENQISIGLDEGIDVTALSLADESTTPSRVTFTQPATLGAALLVGDLDADSYRALYIRTNSGSGRSGRRQCPI